MATQSPGLAIDIVTFCSRLLEEQEISPRARTLALAVSDLLPGTAVNVYLLTDLNHHQFWTPRAKLGDAPVAETSIPAGSGILGSLLREKTPLLLGASTLAREDYAHLNIRRTLKSLAYLPLRREGELLGAIELVNFQAELTEASLASLLPMCEIAAAALASALAYEEERNSSLTSITRITQLYDLEKVFSSTLEMDQLLPIIASKFREVLECQGINIWLIQPDETLLLMHKSGTDPTVAVGLVQRAGEGIAGDVSDSGEPVLISSSDDERLVKRNQPVAKQAVFSLMAAGLIDKGALVGVVEAVNKNDGTPFHDDDAFALTSLTDTAAGALHNASLLMADQGPFVLEPVRRAVLRAEVRGAVTEVLADEGQQVAAGTPLVRMRNFDLESEAARARADLQVASSRATQNQLRYTGFGPAEQERQRLADQNRTLADELRRLQVISPISGVVTTPDIHDLVGTYLDEGAPILEIGDVSRMLARIYVPEFSMRDIRLGAEVRLRPQSWVAPITGRLQSLAPASTLIEAGLIARDQLKGINPPQYYVGTVLLDNSGDLSEGMSGTAKIYVQRRSPAGFAWRFTRDLVQRRIW